MENEIFQPPALYVHLFFFFFLRMGGGDREGRETKPKQPTNQTNPKELECQGEPDRQRNELKSPSSEKRHV